MSIKITTYYNTSEPKTIYNNTINPQSYTGEFVDAVNIMNPVLRIEGTLPNADCNYCYIDVLDRWYYITSITSERNNVTILNCKIDVLRTYRTSLLKCYGLIDRAENDDSHNRYVYDNDFVRETPNAIVHLPFDMSDTASLDRQLVLLTVFGTTPVTP